MRLQPSIAKNAHEGLRAPLDQAHGLRRLFASRTVHVVPLISNPHVLFGGVVMERLCAAWAEMGLRSLVVDAGERAHAPHELADLDLSDAIESLSSHVKYLAARDLPARYVDAQGSSASLLQALVDSSPGTDVVLVHAPATDWIRMVAQPLRSGLAPRLSPLVLADEQAAAVTHAYSSIKLMAQRAGLMAHDLIVLCDEAGERAQRVAHSVATCADRFLHAVQRTWIALDPAQAAQDDPTPAVRDLARAQLDAAVQIAHADTFFASAARTPRMESTASFSV
jgi:flagellar biosynthesis protein FlhG